MQMSHCEPPKKLEHTKNEKKNLQPQQQAYYYVSQQNGQKTHMHTLTIKIAQSSFFLQYFQSFASVLLSPYSKGNACKGIWQQGRISHDEALKKRVHYALAEQASAHDTAADAVAACTDNCTTHYFTISEQNTPVSSIGYQFTPKDWHKSI